MREAESKLVKCRDREQEQGRTGAGWSKRQNNKQQFAKTIDLKVEMATALRDGMMGVEVAVAVEVIARLRLEPFT